MRALSILLATILLAISPPRLMAKTARERDDAALISETLADLLAAPKPE